MFKRIAPLLMACFVASAAWAATDPFIGEWKFNPARSKLSDVMKVSSVGANKYAFDLGAGNEVIVTDHGVFTQRFAVYRGGLCLQANSKRTRFRRHLGQQGRVGKFRPNAPGPSL